MKCYLRIICLFAMMERTKAWYDEWVYSLNGKDWTMKNFNGSISINATVPGNSYTALMKSGKLGNPYYRFNDDEYKWVANETWTFTKNIDALSTFKDGAAFGNIDLVFYGLDTVAMVKMNGHILGKTDNMFHRHVYHVKNYFQDGPNILEVTFSSPLTAASERAKAYPYRVPPVCPPEVQNGDCYVNFLRKEQASFSWDWGPSFPTVGIWKSVELHGYNSAMISQVTAETRPVKNNDYSGDWMVTGTVYFDVGDDESRKVTGELSIEGADSNHYQMITITKEKNAVNYSITVDKDYLKLWWPNGYGSRSLYDLQFNFTSAEYGSEQSIHDVTIGFRTVELVQKPVPGSPGLSFYFKINGQPIFMKGSNWIPADSFEDRITEEYLHILLTSAAEANMNMLRVWGGGVYESDTFYKLADELGILIWQDMMFACALYPTDDNFIESVTQEVTYQVRRLKHHPSIAIWAGNNENEGALVAPWWNLTGVPVSTYDHDYIKLYIDTIRSIVLTEDSSRPFVSSSPSNGEETVKEGWLAKNVYDTHYGDIHYYNYTADGWDYKTNPTPRFASEYGVQSWCSMESLEAVSEPSDLVMDSNFTKHRQHHGDGNKQMLSEVEAHLLLPKSSDPKVVFADFVYLTQINQAVTIKTESEHYIRMQSMVKDGEGMTMGALYWQLNGIWQAPTWASTEFGGKWKMLNYYAKEFFSPVMLSPYLDDNMVRLQFINQSLPSMAHLKVVDENPAKLAINIEEKGKDSLKLDENFSKYAIKTEEKSKDHHKKSFENEDNENCDKDTTLKFKQLYGKFGSGFSRMKRSVEDGVLHIEPEDRHCVASGPLEVVASMYKWSSMVPLKTWKISVNQPSLASTEILSKSTTDFLKDAECRSVDECFLYFTIPQCDVSNWLMLSYFKTAKGLCQTKDRVLITSVDTKHPTLIEITLSTNQIAPFVWLEAKGHPGHFSYNGFMMVEKQVKINFIPWVEKDVQDYNFTVMSLCDIYSRV